ncbi:MAG: hypothetical protein R3B46_13275 [Phycisphaerales bacterium]
MKKTQKTVPTPEKSAPPAAGPRSAIVRVMAQPGQLQSRRKGRKPRNGSVPALNEKEIEQASRVAIRLRAELARVVEELPESARFASGMARHLKVVRPTCQRIVSVLEDREPDATSLVRLPGVKGIEQFLDACRKKGIQPRSVDLAEAALQQFDAYLTAVGGSQRHLAERLRATIAPSQRSEEGAARVRESLFDAAALVTGRRCDVSLSIYIFRAIDGDPRMLERALAHGLIASEVRPGGMPMVLSSGNTLRFDEPDGPARLLDDEPAIGRTNSAILAPFTTHPLPTVTSRGEQGKLVQVIDPDTLGSAAVLDVVLAERSRHPFLDEKGNPTLNEVWTLVNCPTRTLIFDVYLDEALERAFRPSIDAQQWYPNLTSPGDDRWITRYPGKPSLQLLSRGAEAPSPAANPRHAELTRYFFERLRINPSQYFGFRCEVRYPIWRAGYRMQFEPVGDVSH